MKILFIACLVVMAISVEISKPCVVELAKLTAKLGKLYVDVHAAKIPATVTDIVATWKEIKLVKEKCSAQEQAEFLNYSRDIAECVQDTFAVSQATYKAYSDYEANGMTPELLVELDAIALQIDPMIAVCDSPAAAEHFNAMFPPECINSLEGLGIDALNIIADQNKAAQIVKDLVKLAKDYKSAKSSCPFIK